MLENEGLSFKPHAKLYPDPEWKINIPSSAIMNDATIQSFIHSKAPEDDLHGAPRKFTKKELDRILADYHAEKSKKAADKVKDTDFNTIINSEWSNVISPPAVMPEEEVIARNREDQLIRMGVPYIKRTFYYREFLKFHDDIIDAIQSLNDTIGSALKEYTVMTFKPIAIYTDYIGRLFNSFDSIMMLHDDASADCISTAIFNCRFGVDSLKMSTRPEANHISFIFESSVEKYNDYSQLHHSSPVEKDISYVRYTLLLGGRKNE